MIGNSGTSQVRYNNAGNITGMPNNLTFGKDPGKTNADGYKEDTILNDNFSTRFRVNNEKTSNIPLVHFPRGLKGAQDYTFFEFLQTAKFPYYVGGPILAALFYAGVKYDKPNSGKAARRAAKHIAVGVALYYVGAQLAKSIVNTAVRISRGINLEQPYRKVIPTSTDQTGAFKRDTEYHKVFESIDFTRWDLLYGHGGTNNEINQKYNKLAKKYNLDANSASDADSSLKPLIRKTIAMARAWQYGLTAAFVCLGIGMANQDAWVQESKNGFRFDVRHGVFGKKLKMETRLENAGRVIKEYILKPISDSFKQFWKGRNKTTSIIGKATILAAGLGIVLSNFLIMTRTSAGKHRVEKTSYEAQGKKPDEVKQ